MKDIVIIGAGNVATHLSIALKNAGYNIVQVFSRDLANADCLAPMLDAEAINDLSAINTSADLYIISVSDTVIEQVANDMPLVDGIVVHTAGTIDASVLSRFSLYGVLYPFQTFTKDKELDFDKVPILIEGSISHSRKEISDVANSISSHVQKADGAKRKALHISAVFTCNFVNHLYALAEDLLEREGLNFSLLSPLIRETTQKALSMKPSDAQTGPAKRNDKVVIQEHLEALDSISFHHDIYALLSESIMQKHKDNN